MKGGEILQRRVSFIDPQIRAGHIPPRIRSVPQTAFRPGRAHDLCHGDFFRFGFNGSGDAEREHRPGSIARGAAVGGGHFHTAGVYFQIAALSPADIHHIRHLLQPGGDNLLGVRNRDAARHHQNEGGEIPVGRERPHNLRSPARAGRHDVADKRLRHVPCDDRPVFLAGEGLVVIALRTFSRLGEYLVGEDRQGDRGHAANGVERHLDAPVRSRLRRAARGKAHLYRDEPAPSNIVADIVHLPDTVQSVLQHLRRVAVNPFQPGVGGARNRLVDLGLCVIQHRRMLRLPRLSRRYRFGGGQNLAPPDHRHLISTHRGVGQKLLDRQRHAADVTGLQIVQPRFTGVILQRRHLGLNLTDKLLLLPHGQKLTDGGRRPDPRRWPQGVDRGHDRIALRRQLRQRLVAECVHEIEGVFDLFAIPRLTHAGGVGREAA